VVKLVNDSERPFGLLLCNYAINQGAVVAESVNAFHDYSRYPYHIYSWNFGFKEEFDYDAFDFLVIHYSVIPSLPGFLSVGVAERIRRFKGLKVQMIQDDYRMNSLLVRFIKECGIDVVYTVAPPAAAKALYSDQVPGLNVETYLTGYVSDWLKLEPPLPLRKRSYDVGYRGRKYPYWFGQPVIDKVELADTFAKKLARYRLRHNISTREKDRVYGRAWVDFLRNCRAIFGMESDIHYIDPNGYVHHWYETMEQLIGKKRWNGKEALQNPFFSEHAQPAPAPLAVIPPRVFETIAVRSANILVEGEYSGVLQPWRHYIPLKKDLSNVDDVVHALQDEALLSDIIAVSFGEIGQNRGFSYAGFASQMDETIERHLRPSRARSLQLVGNARKQGLRPDITNGMQPPIGLKDARKVVHQKANPETDPIDIEAITKKAPFYYLGNPNAYRVKRPTVWDAMRAGNLRPLLTRAARRVLPR
jgi:hypothetical protein